MKKKVYIVMSIVAALFIIVVVMLSTKITNKKTQNDEKIGKVEEIQEESNVQALETEPQVPETWDLNKVYPVLSEDNIYVPVPIGFTASGADTEHTVNTGFVIYEGTGKVNNENAWEQSKNRNQFVWVPVPDSSRIYEVDSGTGLKKAKLYNFNSTGRTSYVNNNLEPGVLNKSNKNTIRNCIQNKKIGIGCSKDLFYKQLRMEFNKTIESIEKYGGFYIGRYESRSE